jgi:hypothetical protein
MEDRLQQLRSDAIKLVADSDGLRIGDIAEGLGISVELAKVVVRPLVGEKLEMKGVKKGAKYYAMQSERGKRQ